MSNSILRGLAVLTVGLLASVCSAEMTGVYMETRTCEVYTGPCFANGDVSLTGRDAIMAWKIEDGKQDKVDVSGLSVVMVVNATDTLGFRGFKDVRKVKSIILVDQKADKLQQEALVSFAKKHAGQAGKNVVRVKTAPISFKLDTFKLTGKLKAGKSVELETRKARPEDCICSNESAYYPPLAKLENFAPGVTLKGKFSGRGLGTRWSTPGARSSYMATFKYN